MFHVKEVAMQKIIIDTDPGQDIDDLLALTFALRRPELDIRAITTVTQPSDKRARMVKRLLRYMDRSDIPVAAGRQFPLREVSPAKVQDPHEFLRTMNHYAFAEPEDPRDQPGKEDAVDLIIRTVEESPGEIALACIAPLTNIACALRKKPEVARKIKYIAMMGGEITLNRIEHNVAFDEIAADVVLTSGVPIFMGTWDVTRRFVLSKDDCELFRRSPSPLCQALGRAIDLWHPVQNWKPGPVMYDMFPIVWSFDRSYYTTTPKSVRIETKGEITRGMTVACGNVPNIEVTTDMRSSELRDLYLKTVLENP
jgi:purine nucleosidase/pyrimidine-specific ribonucleoside hydrolase